MWNYYLENLQGAEVCRAAKFANLQAGVTVEALSGREGRFATTITVKDEMLRRDSYPPNQYNL